MADSRSKGQDLNAKPQKKQVGNGLWAVTHGSNPSLSAENHGFQPQYSRFSNSLQEPWQFMAEKKFPYDLCRLVHYDYDLSKRWYVIFRAYDIYLERVRRVRISNPMNKEKSLAGRLRVAEEIMTQTDADLRQGKLLGRERIKQITGSDNLHLKTLLQVIDIFVVKKRAAMRRKNYLRRFTVNLKFHITNYYSSEGIEDINIRSVNAEFVQGLFAYLRPLVAPKTFNNMRGDLATVLNFINKLKPGLVKDKPWSAIDKLPVIARKHAAFNDSQIKAIVDKATAMNYHDLVLFCQIEYYTLARPAEISDLKISDFDLTQNRIIFRGDAAKNWRDEYVTIGERFRQIIEKSGILNRPADSYVFFYMRDGKQHKRGRKYFRLPLSKVLKALDMYKINANFSLYSFKHSGAVSLYLATKDMWVVMEQCRHKTIAQTGEYLRDLGLLRKESPVINFVGAA